MVIGLVNNMPDAAVFATEAQFRRRLETAAAGRPFELRLLTLDGVPRSRATLSRMQARYRAFRSVGEEPLDGLIVTGAEPRTARLEEEAYWPALSALVDWARDNTASTIWSCLAAHAALWRLDGIHRRKLTRKLSGVFAVRRAGEHRLLAGSCDRPLVPHSRLNGVSAMTLEAAGYQVLTRSGRVGVDAFVRENGSLFVFLQGHPEYDGATLLLEYQRDLRRFIRGDQPAPPSIPQGYFHPKTVAALKALTARTMARPSDEALSESAAIVAAAPPEARWSAWTDQFYGNWLDLVAERSKGLQEKTGAFGS